MGLLLACTGPCAGQPHAIELPLQRLTHLFDDFVPLTGRLIPNQQSLFVRKLLCNLAQVSAALDANLNWISFAHSHAND